MKSSVNASNPELLGFDFDKLRSALVGELESSCEIYEELNLQSVH